MKFFFKLKSMLQYGSLQQESISVNLIFDYSH